MNNLITKSKLNDKYYKKYKYLFNYLSKKWNIINKILLFNNIYSFDNIYCNYIFNEIDFTKLYNNIFFDNKNTYLIKTTKTEKFNTSFIYLIINKYFSKNRILFIINTNILLKQYTLLKKNINCDIIDFYNIDFSYTQFKLKSNPFVNYNLFNNYYPVSYLYLYKQFLINLKNNENTDSISIPTTKYKFIMCHFGYIGGLSLCASYKMTLQIPHLIGTIAMSLKLIEKNGTLLLFWSILNVHIPVIKKLLSLLAYGFKTIEIIDDDINQNLLVGVPEYYIKCSGYKDNISNELINQLLEVAIDTLDNIYEACSILDYYEDYTEQNPNHTLFYNKQEKEYKTDKNKRLTKKKDMKSVKSAQLSSASSKSITPIYYIEDINLPELDKIVNNSKIQFEVSILSNKLEGLFVGFFQMVNNLIENAIAKDEKGIMYVKKEYILQRDITNITRLINMFEYNKLPYNKNAITVLFNKKNEVVDNFYSLNKFINHTMLKYNQHQSKLILNHTLDSGLKLSKKTINYMRKSGTQSDTQSGTQLLLDDSGTDSSDTSKLLDTDIDLNIVAKYYNRIKLALQVRNNLLDKSDFESAPSIIRYNINDFGSGISHFINYKYKSLPLKIEMSFLKQWEILNTFRLMPENLTSFNVLFLCEPSQQSIMACQYWVTQRCPILKLENYHWYANTLNPHNSSNKKGIHKLHEDAYDLDMIDNKDNKDNKDNENKWLWGDDNSGDITNVKNLKSIQKQIQDKLAPTKQKLDLIIGNGNINDKYNGGSFINDNFKDTILTEYDELDIQKMEISQVIAVIANSSIGGSCCVKHYIPYKNLNKIDEDNKDKKHTIQITNDNTETETIKTNWMFISYLYIYYLCFETMSLYKPMSSFADNGEFYVICRDFKGVNKTMLNKLYSKLNKFKVNDTLIEKNTIPEAFIMQLNEFLMKMSDVNVETIEKQNLVLTCFKSLNEKVANCDYFLNKKIIHTMLIPKYKEWINIFNFE